MKDRLKQSTLSPLFWITVLLAGIVMLTLFGPAEKSLGKNVRVVYLHGAWVWTSLVVLIASGVVALTAILTRQSVLHSWSRALGRTGLLFWITYLPISILAMQTNWNGLFLAEPRWRLALIFAITGLLLQIGLALIDRPLWTSTANIAFIVVLLFSLAGTREVMHPRSPILTSDSKLIQGYFAAMVVATLLVAWQVARWWQKLEPAANKTLIR